MLVHVRCPLRDKIAVWTLEARRLTAFVLYMRYQAAFLVVYARTIRAGKHRHVPRAVVHIFYQPEGRTETCKRKSTVRKSHKINVVQVKIFFFIPLLSLLQGSILVTGLEHIIIII